jgi:RTX calcium-binding nonapeptide repeat (4 copies)
MIAKNSRASVAADAVAMIIGVSPLVKRALLIVATMMLGVVMLSGVVLAKNVTGTNRVNELKGTNKADKIRGLGGPDDINGREAADELYGGSGKDKVRGQRGRDYIDGGRDTDKLFGDRGNDTMKAKDGYKDHVNCGAGANDKAYIDADLDTWVNCEDVRGGGGPIVDPPGGGGGTTDPDSSNPITGDYLGMRNTVGASPPTSMECYTFYSDRTVELRHNGLPNVNETGSYQGDATGGKIVWKNSGKVPSSVVAQRDGSLKIDGLTVTRIDSCLSPP